MPELARQLEAILQRYPRSHGFLLRGHGLYTWGENLSEARRHVEILEFLLEVVGRTCGSARGHAAAVGGLGTCARLRECQRVEGTPWLRSGFRTRTGASQSPKRCARTWQASESTTNVGSRRIL